MGDATGAPISRNLVSITWCDGEHEPGGVAILGTHIELEDKEIERKLSREERG